MVAAVLSVGERKKTWGFAAPFMGVKTITKHLNEAGIRTRDGRRWSIGAVHKVLTRGGALGRRPNLRKHATACEMPSFPSLRPPLR